MEVSNSIPLNVIQLVNSGLLIYLRYSATIKLEMAVAIEQNYIIFTGDYNTFVADHGYIGNFIPAVSIAASIESPMIWTLIEYTAVCALLGALQRVVLLLIHGLYGWHRIYFFSTLLTGSSFDLGLSQSCHDKWSC